MAVVEKDISGQSSRLPVAAIAGYLQDVLGQRLAAVVAGVSDAKAVGKWARGQRRPHPETEARLRDAYLVVELLLREESTATVRAWLLGMNPDLDDQAPAIVLGQEPRRVLRAARSFLANG
jgi:hypothetical protein